MEPGSERVYFSSFINISIVLQGSEAGGQAEGEVGEDESRVNWAS